MLSFEGEIATESISGKCGARLEKMSSIWLIVVVAILPELSLGKSQI